MLPVNVGSIDSKEKRIDTYPQKGIGTLGNCVTVELALSDHPELQQKMAANRR